MLNASILTLTRINSIFRLSRAPYKWRIPLYRIMLHTRLINNMYLRDLRMKK